MLKNSRSFHLTPKNDFLYLVGIGLVATTAISYLTFEHLYVKYKNQTITANNEKLEFGPHALFSLKHDSVGIDIGSNFVKIANLLPLQKGSINQTHLPQLLKLIKDNKNGNDIDHSNMDRVEAIKLNNDQHSPYNGILNENALKSSIQTVLDIEVGVVLPPPPTSFLFVVVIFSPTAILYMSVYLFFYMNLRRR